MQHYSRLFLIILITFLGIAQIFQNNLYGQGMVIWEPNVYSITPEIPVITPELFTLSDPGVYSHPEFGLLPEDAPCIDCIELIDRRTFNSRYFVKNGTNGNTFYQQTAYGDLHYTDDLGRLISFDRRLKQESETYYEAEDQATPTTLDVAEKRTSFKINGEEFIFNNHLQLSHILPSGGVDIIGVADWTNRTVGDHGIYITDAWPNIDIKITFDLNMVKTNYIIKAPLGLPGGYLAISDQLVLPENYAVEIGEGEDGIIGWNGSLFVSSTTDFAYGFEIGRAIAYDNKVILDKNLVGDHAYNPEYIYDSLTQNLIIALPVSWLNNPELIYPIVIDPLVTSTATYGSLIKFRYNGAYCAWTNYCEYTLDVPLPPNCTLTAATFSSQYITVAGTCLYACWMLEAAFRMWSDSCSAYSPDVPYYWSCPLGAYIGTCTAINFDMFDLFSCLTPKCSGSIPIDMRTSYCYCNTNGTCPAGASVPCHKMNASSWSVTLTGHNLETLGDVADGNGSVTYNSTTCCEDFLLDPAPDYGVPPYTYLWTDGSTDPDTTVIECSNGSFVYTCTVTDACNITRTATFTIVVDDCFLPITLSNFVCTPNDDAIQLIWNTETETNCADFFILRSTDGINYEEIGSIPCHGTTTSPQTYVFKDDRPLPGDNYYLLKQVDLYDQAITYSEIISCSTTDHQNTQQKYYNLMGERIEIDQVPAGIYILETIIEFIPYRQLIIK